MAVKLLVDSFWCTLLSSFFISLSIRLTVFLIHSSVCPSVESKLVDSFNFLILRVVGKYNCYLGALFVWYLNSSQFFFFFHRFLTMPRNFYSVHFCFRYLRFGIPCSFSFFIFESFLFSIFCFEFLSLSVHTLSSDQTTSTHKHTRSSTDLPTAFVVAEFLIQHFNGWTRWRDW